MQKLQCTCCGGKLVMREDGVAACQFCGMEYAPETVRKMIVEMRGSVQVEGVDTADSIAKRAEIFMSMNDVENAAANFRKLTQLYPDDYRGWWGLTRLSDWDIYFRQNVGKELKMPMLCQRAFQFAPNDKKAEIQAFFEEKVRSVGTRVEANYAQTQRDAQSIEARIQQYVTQINRLSVQRLQEQDKRRIMENKGYFFKASEYVFTVSLFLLVAAIVVTCFFPHPVVLVILLATILFFCRNVYIKIQMGRYRKMGKRIAELQEMQEKLISERKQLEDELKQIQNRPM